MFGQVAGQTYFKAVEESDLYFNQIIHRFSNGDVLVGDSFLGPLQNGGENGKVVMARIDNCGQKLWAYSYSLGSGYLEVRDVIIQQSDEIVAYGSHFNGIEDVLFLLRINGKTGKMAVFRLYYPQTTNGYFAYSLNKVDRQFTVLGLLANPNTGFIASFDEALLPSWAKKIKPFDPNGEAIVSRDKHMIVRSGSYLFSIDVNGSFRWKNKLNISTVNGPLETDSGYILVGHSGGYSFFYKIDDTGKLLWQSAMFPAVESSGAMSLLTNGNILFTYNCPFATANKLCQMILTPAGNILEQRQLEIPLSINSGRISQTIHESNMITIAANESAFVTANVDVQDFLMQFSLDELKNDCVNWINMQETIPNSIQLVFEPAELNAEDFDLHLNQRIEAQIDTFLYPLTAFCGGAVDPSFISKDTLLNCGEGWLVSLPDDHFSWLDGNTDNPRLLEMTGIYKAKNEDCLKPIELEFKLEKEDCGCPAFLPNAFSPNNDGINDELPFFADCQLDAFQMRVFNRFGELIFYSDTFGEFWDGRYRQKIVPMGVYVVTVEYQWTDLEGKQRYEQMARSVTLIK